MRFEVIPAIDVAGGRLAAYASSGPESVEAFGGDPFAAAREFIASGARWLHVVDVDLAVMGEARNLEVIRQISTLGASVQASGGVRTAEDVQATLDAGAQRVVLGSGVLADEGATLGAIDRFADRLVVGIEVQEDRIRARGRTGIDLPLVETLGWLVAGGARAFLVTAVARVGTLLGPDLEIVERVTRTGRPVVAAGGIGSIGDLQRVRRAGAAGAVVGRAAIEGELDLVAAFGLI